jgi:hypothetical protein
MEGTSRASRVVVGALVAATLLFGAVTPAGAAPPQKHQVTVNDTFDGPPFVPFIVSEMPTAAGIYKMGLANNSVGPHVLVVIGGLDPGLTEDEFRDIVHAVETAGAPEPEGSFFVGAVFSKPGQDHQKLMDLTTEGKYGYFCPIPTPNGTPHYDLGFVGLFEVG